MRATDGTPKYVTHDVSKKDAFTIKELFSFQLQLRYNIPQEENEPMQERKNNVKRQNPGKNVDDAENKILGFNTLETHYAEELAESVVSYLRTQGKNPPLSIGITALGDGTFVHHIAQLLEKQRLKATLHLFDNSQYFLGLTLEILNSVEYTFVEFQAHLTDISDATSYPDDISIDLLFGTELLDCLPENYYIRINEKWYQLLFQLTNQRGNRIRKDHAVQKIETWNRKQHIPNHYSWQVLITDIIEPIVLDTEENLMIVPSLDLFEFANRVHAHHITMIDYFANNLLFQPILDKSSASRFSLRFEDKYNDYILETPSMRDGNIQLPSIPVGVDVTFAPDTDFFIKAAKKFGYSSFFHGIWLGFVLNYLGKDMTKQISDFIFKWIRHAAIEYFRSISAEFGGIYQREVINKITNLPLMRGFSSMADDFVAEKTLSMEELLKFASVQSSNDQHISEFFQILKNLPIFLNQGLLIISKEE